jgi:two-component system response regulator ResD
MLLIEGVMANQILVVDDERIVTEVVERYLRLEGYEVKIAQDGAQALKIAGEWHPDLVVLDLMLPEIDGLEVCRQLRQDRSVPIIMLTAKGEETDRIVGLELGADDYMVKPFSPRELVARVKSVLRRTTDGISRKTDDLLRYGDLDIDPMAREVTSRGHRISLTAKEFDLLYFLASHPNEVFTRDQLMNQVWDYAYSAEYGTITVHIRRLRAKIETDPLKPRFIKTLWGVGYKFEGVEHETKR